jgi:hypothetical protein
VKFTIADIDYSIVDLTESSFRVIDETGFVLISVHDVDTVISAVEYYCPDRGHVNTRYCTREYFESLVHLAQEAILQQHNKDR